MNAVMEERKVLKFDVTVTRTTQKCLSPEKLKDQLQFIASAAQRNSTANWDVKIPKRLLSQVESGEGESRQVHYSAVIQVHKERYIDAEAVRRRFDKTLAVMAKAANRKGWQVVSDEAMVLQPSGLLAVVNGSGEVMDDPAPRLLDFTNGVPKLKTKRALPPKSPFLEGEPLPPLTPDVYAKYFKRIYDRESHIRIIYDHLCLAVRTGFKTRHHTLLKGKPACAKTELFLSFIDWLGDSLIEQVDASTMTKAGLERMLLDKANDGELKPILIMEEVEKTPIENVSCLIQVMDARGKIQRTNANTVRDGGGIADCPIVIWGTCNDEAHLEKFHDGALWSRFSNKLDCYRPDRDLMERILMREVEEIQGKPEWVSPVLRFCYDELVQHKKFASDFDDPRFARSLLAGGDRLLDDSLDGYLADIRKTRGLRK
jgi:MoxR-like ATPase